MGRQRQRGRPTASSTLASSSGGSLRNTGEEMHARSVNVLPIFVGLSMEMKLGRTEQLASPTIPWRLPPKM
eukprot:11174551-Lingulodinium_polyedra.AAC.1